jgi:hypothetical protein
MGIKINELLAGGGLTDTSATAIYNPGQIYENEDTGAKYQYVGPTSAYISAYFQVAVTTAEDGVSMRVIKKPTTSTTIGQGIPQVNMPLGYYGFIKKTGVAEAYVTSSVALGAELMGHASTAGCLAAKTSTVASGVAKTLEVGLGLGTTTTVLLLYPC